MTCFEAKSGIYAAAKTHKKRNTKGFLHCKIGLRHAPNLVRSRIPPGADKRQHCDALCALSRL